jgi:hypothetical protein
LSDLAFGPNSAISAPSALNDNPFAQPDTPTIAAAPGRGIMRGINDCFPKEKS